MGGKKAKKLTLEIYSDFVAKPNQIRLTIDQINQIMYMHGFGKFYGIQKKEYLEKLDQIKLFSAIRSTLKEEMLSSCHIGVKEVENDLLALEWSECCVQSVETLRSEKDNDGDLEFSDCVSSGDKARKRNPKRKRQSSSSLSSESC